MLQPISGESLISNDSPSDIEAYPSRRPRVVCNDIQQFKINPLDTPQIAKKKQG